MIASSRSMSPRLVGALALLTAAGTAAWVALLIATVASSPAASSLADRVSAIDSQRTLFMITYANAGLLTALAVVAFVGFYFFCRDESPWAAVGLVFVPIYGMGNLVAYLSQVFVVPGLISAYHEPATNAVASTLLGLTIHTQPGSAVEFLNGLSYAVLGVPSIIFGALMWRRARSFRIGGGLLALSGVLSIVALIGLGFGSRALAAAVLASGFVYLIAVALLGSRLVRRRGETARPA